LIYDYPDQLFAEKGVMAIEHADFEGVERLAQVLGKDLRHSSYGRSERVCCLGGDIVSTFDTPDKVRLGKCDLIEEVMIGEDKLIKFSGMAG
jgi:T-complex protein 1 subunit beta